MKIDVEDDEAYLKCINLLDDQFTSKEQLYYKTTKQIKLNIKTLEEHVFLCSTQKDHKLRDIQQLKQEIYDLEKSIERKHNQKKRHIVLKDQIEEHLFTIDSNCKKIQEFKEKSYQQKSNYIEAQSTEFRLNQLIEQYQEEDRDYEESILWVQRYKKLQKIKNKVENKQMFDTTDVEAYIEVKINEMASLRTNLVHLDESLQKISIKTEDQHFIIEALLEKSERENGEEEAHLFQKYKDKYQQLYFSTDHDAGQWSDYRKYLTELLKKRKVNQIRQTTQIDHYNRRYENSLESNQRARINSAKIIDFRKKQSVFTTKAIHEDKTKRLPQLVKMNVNNKDKKEMKQNLKQNLKSYLRQSEVSLESIGTNSSVSGEFIEVEFHKMK